MHSLFVLALWFSARSVVTSATAETQSRLFAQQNVHWDVYLSHILYPMAEQKEALSEGNPVVGNPVRAFCRFLWASSPAGAFTPPVSGARILMSKPSLTSSRPASFGHRMLGPFGEPAYLTMYRKNLEKGSSPWKALNFGSRSEQKKMFNVLTDEIDYDRCSVLDVGCGTGDFANHLLGKRMIPSMLRGIDPMREFVEEARRIAPPWAEYSVGDPVAQPRLLGKKWDWIVISGVIQNLPPRQAKQLLANCWRAARYGMVFSFLPTSDGERSWQRVRPLDPDNPSAIGQDTGWLHLVDTQELVDWGYRVGASEVGLREDYLGGQDATIVMRRPDSPPPPPRSPKEWLTKWLTK